MFEPARAVVRPVVSGTHARTNGLKFLRVACLVTLAAIAAQFALGMFVNMYVQVPSSDSHASWLQEIQTAPAALTAHAVIGLLLLVGAVLVVIQSVALRNWRLIAAAGTGLLAMLGAFGAGEAFVKDGSNTESLAMSILASAGLLCFAVVQAIAHSEAHRADPQA